MDRAKTSPCIVCHDELYNIFETDRNQPMGGTEFTTYGHYGSGVWDEIHGKMLAINVCDKCLKDFLSQQGNSFVIDPPIPSKPSYRPFVYQEQQDGEQSSH